MRRLYITLTGVLISLVLLSQVGIAQDYFKLIPDRVFDGKNLHEQWVVVVQGSTIEFAGPEGSWKGDAQIIALPGTTLLPGLIEGHAHMFLYPYDQTPWNDQVLKESESLRMARAVKHAEKTLKAGFTTVRDLGTEGAGYADASLKKAIQLGIIHGPRLLISSKAIVATGSYGPKGFADNFRVPLGAEEADGYDEIIRVVRDQIGHGADFIKVYADYRWGPAGEARPTFSTEELKLMVQTAQSSGRYVVAHASTSEGMRRSVEAGVETIEHGDGGTLEVWELLKQKGVAYCPTLAAGDAVMQYQGWKKGQEPDPPRIIQKKASFKAALEAGVTIISGGDVGVFEHGDNVRELEMMVEYGMKPLEVLQSATSVNARVFHLDQHVGMVKSGMLADLIVVSGDPTKNISDLRNIRLVIKNGVIEADNRVTGK